MRKWIAGSVVVIFCLVLIGCGGGGPNAVMGEYLDVFEGYINDMEKAGSADDVVKAINKFADNTEALIPRMKALNEKYPELKTQNMQGDLPPGFEKEEKRLKELMPRVQGAMAGMMKYMTDPKVQEAQKRMGEVMMKMK